MGMLKIFAKWLWAAFEVADTTVQFFGGWVIAWGSAVGMLTSIWGMVINAGPITVPIAFAAAAAAMIFFDAVKSVLEPLRIASRENIEIANILDELTLKGTGLIYEMDTNKEINVSREEVFWPWMLSSLDAVKRTKLSEEYHDLKSISNPREFHSKLRAIKSNFIRTKKIEIGDIKETDK